MGAKHLCGLQPSTIRVKDQPSVAVGLRCQRGLFEKKETRLLSDRQTRAFCTAEKAPSGEIDEEINSRDTRKQARGEVNLIPRRREKQRAPDGTTPPGLLFWDKAGSSFYLMCRQHTVIAGHGQPPYQLVNAAARPHSEVRYSDGEQRVTKTDLKSIYLMGHELIASTPTAQSKVLLKSQPD